MSKFSVFLTGGSGGPGGPGGPGGSSHKKCREQSEPLVCTSSQNSLATELNWSFESLDNSKQTNKLRMLPGRLNDKFRVFGAKSHGDPRWSKTSKATKVKNKFVNGKKSSKEYSVVFLVEGEKFNLGKKNSTIKFRRKVQISLVGSVANSVGTPLEFAAFRSGFDAKYSRASAFWFFLSPTIVFTVVRTHFARKTSAFSC